jgi:hypothetical protein
MEAMVQAADRIADFYDAVAALIGVRRGAALSTIAYGAEQPGRLEAIFDLGRPETIIPQPLGQLSGVHLP